MPTPNSINAILAKDINNEMTYVYPKTTSDNVQYSGTKTGIANTLTEFMDNTQKCVGRNFAPVVSPDIIANKISHSGERAVFLILYTTPFTYTRYYILGTVDNDRLVRIYMIDEDTKKEILYCKLPVKINHANIQFGIDSIISGNTVSEISFDLHGEFTYADGDSTTAEVIRTAEDGTETSFEVTVPMTVVNKYRDVSVNIANDTVSISYSGVSDTDVHYETVCMWINDNRYTIYCDNQKYININGLKCFYIDGKLRCNKILDIDKKYLYIGIERNNLASDNNIYSYFNYPYLDTNKYLYICAISLDYIINELQNDEHVLIESNDNCRIIPIDRNLFGGKIDFIAGINAINGFLFAYDTIHLDDNTYTSTLQPYIARSNLVLAKIDLYSGVRSTALKRSNILFEPTNTNDPYYAYMNDYYRTDGNTRSIQIYLKEQEHVKFEYRNGSQEFPFQTWDDVCNLNRSLHTINAPLSLMDVHADFSYINSIYIERCPIPIYVMYITPPSSLKNFNIRSSTVYLSALPEDTTGAFFLLPMYSTVYLQDSNKFGLAGNYSTIITNEHIKASSGRGTVTAYSTALKDDTEAQTYLFGSDPV